MIHSMSGGVIKDVGSYTFVKVRKTDADAPRWYISDFEVQEGDKVIVPGGDVATVIRVEYNVDGRVTPIPLKRAQKLVSKA